MEKKKLHKDPIVEQDEEYDEYDIDDNDNNNLSYIKNDEIRKPILA